MNDWCYTAALVPTIAILAIIFLIGAVGNICACLVIIRTKSLHTRANYFLLTLACSDVLLLFLGCPLDIYMWINCNEGSVFLCKFWSFVREAYGFTSIVIICAFTAERWLAVRDPLQLNVKPRNLCFAFAAVSSLALLAAAGLRLNAISTEKFEASANETIEECKFPQTPFFQYTTVFIFILSYLIPVVMLATMCIQIAASARPTASTVELESSRKAPFKMFGLLVAVVVSFLICWSPHRIEQLNFVFDFVELDISVMLVINSITACCYYLNCAVNPILYNMFSKNFRRALVHMISGGRLTATANAACSATIESNKTLAVTVTQLI